jgi:uncharacterized protein YndB with AHSA1/START domain
MQVQVNVRERILKPINEVFEAIMDPTKMSRYFTSSASGRLKAGTMVTWEFADVGAKIDVDVVEIQEDRRIVVEAAMSGPKTRITMDFKADDPHITVLTINESDFPLDAEGVKRAMGQTAGWTYFLACLKANLQFSVDLRAGLNKKLTDV